MSQIQKLFLLICSGKSDRNIKFAELQSVLLALGFVLSRINGDHFIYTKVGIEEIINIQPDKGDSSKAKSIQVKQIRNIIKKYDMEVWKAMTNYERVIFWSKEDNCWVVEVPELPGCQADGSTPEEAFKNSELIIQEWIDTAISLGRKVPEPMGRFAFA